jgi:hypothetical protein
MVDYVLYYGVDEPPPTRLPLRAGPLSLVYEGGDLRYIRLGERELVRRVYVAVRDHNWGTVPGAIANERIDIGRERFQITYEMAHRRGPIDFVWQADIRGEADGTIRFAMDGVARAPFRTNRTGFCVLHPLEAAGARARVEHIDGSIEETTFPRLIAPQRLAGGKPQPVPPFAEMRALAHEAAPGVWVGVRFEGDIFELEDQRNWIDASFKTYCRPLRLPFPYDLAAGERVRQAVTVSLREDGRQAAGGGWRLAAGGRPADAESVTLALEPGARRALPPVGLGGAGLGAPLTARQAERLRLLRPAHLRVDLAPPAPAALDRLRRAAEEARAVGAPLEVALFLAADADAGLAQLRAALAELRPAIARWLIFSTSVPTTPPGLVAQARAALEDLAPGAAFAGGTDAYFTDLNRDWPAMGGLDLITYSINPQVHAFDNASLAETPAAIAATVETARARSAGRPILVSPVTLKPRFNPVATGPEAEPLPGELPPQVDPRQMSLFGAGWTLASLKYLLESGAAATYYELVGWRGVMEADAGSPLPERFRSAPGAVFPLFHVLADVGAFAGGEVIPSLSSAPLAVMGLALAHDGARRVLLANLTPEPQAVRLALGAAQARVRLLDETTAATAARDPEAFHADPGAPLAAENGVLALALRPYAVVRVDASE